MLLDFTIPADEAKKLLDMCPNLEDLTSWSISKPHDLWPTISKLANLRRLTVATAMSTKSQLSESASASHLEIIRSSGALPDMLYGLPRLSHLALWDGFIDYEGLAKALRSCDNLHIVIIYADMVRGIIQGMYAAELRMAVIYYLSRRKVDWLNGARGGTDTWRFAEHVVFARKGGRMSTAGG